MFIILARQYSLDDGSLIGVEDVGLVPLEEDVVHWYLLTSHEVARVVCRLHGVSFYPDKEVGALKVWYEIVLAFVLHEGDIGSECARHGAGRYEWNSLNASLRQLMDSRRIFSIIL